MHEPIKIKVDKDEEIAVVLEKIIDADCQQITLIIPRFSHIGESSFNFRILKRESDVLNKKIIIESIDIKVLELAEKNGLEAENPFFGKEEEKLKEGAGEVIEEKIEIPAKKTRGRKKKNISVELKTIESEPIEEVSDEELEGITEYVKKGRAMRVADEQIKTNLLKAGWEEKQIEKVIKIKKEPKKIIFEEEEEEQPRSKSYSELVNEINQKRNYKGMFISTVKTSLRLISVGLVVGIIYLVVFSILPRAEVKILTKKTEWSYNDSIAVEKVVKPESGAMTIGGQVFSEKKNYELKVPATGKKNVSNKAIGEITIYNGYSSARLSLGANTKLTFSDGKIFILTKSVTIPGAQIVDGKVVSSTVKVQITAEKAGEEYNVKAGKFNILSFKGTPKYVSVYGESDTDMKDGYVGEVAYPTPEDIQKAKSQINQILEKGLRETITAKIPNNFKVLDGATNFVILKQTVKEEIDKDNNFSIFSEAQLKVIVFEEEALNNLLLSKALEEKGQDLEVKTKDLKYGLARGDFANDKLSFPVEFTVVLRKTIDGGSLKEKISGQSDLELRKIIFALPGLENASISFWPFWVNWVPKNTDKIKVIID